MMHSTLSRLLVTLLLNVVTNDLLFVKTINSGFLQIQILVNVLLTPGYQPSLTKFREDVAYFSKLNLPFLPQIMNEK